MIRVTVDTNVLISATFWYGASARVIEKAERKELVLVLSEAILEEYAEVLQYEEIQEKIKDKHLEFKQSVLKISAIAEIIEVKSKLSVVKDDPDDNSILECALDGNVQYLLTKDNHLLDLKEFLGIKIITPEDFLTLIPSSPP